MLNIGNPSKENNQNILLTSPNNNPSNSPTSPLLNIIPPLDFQNDNEYINNNISELSSILQEIPLHNLNDYYNIETNIFKRRIEKLNLQFFWIYESILEGQNFNNNNTENNINNSSKQTLIFPYNKLFLILFKEISLYIEEIIRLNKQLNSKNKNEKIYLNKLNDYKIKEKDYLMNKQMIKTLQRNISNLEKNIEKLKKENEKLNKKLFSEKYSHTKNFNGNNNINKHGFCFSINNNINNYRYQNYQRANTIYNEYYGFNNLTDQENINSSNRNNFSIKTNKIMNKVNKSPSKEIVKTINKEDMNKLINSCDRLYEKNEYYNFYTNTETDNDNKNLVYMNINQCQDEINNLNKIENLLMNFIQNGTKNLSTESNKDIKNLMNSPKNNVKYKINIDKNNHSSSKKFLFNDKKIKKINKVLDFRSNIITNKNKS